MNKTILFFILLISSIKFWAQIDISVKQSEIFKDDEKRTTLLFTESDGKGGIITIRSFLKGIYIDQYNSDLKQVQDYTIEMPLLQIQGILIKDNTVNLIGRIHDKKSKEYKYVLYSSSTDKFNFVAKDLVSINEDEFFKLGILSVNSKYLDDDSFGKLVFSDNKSFFAINFDMKNPKEKNEAHKIFVFNDKFEKIYTTDFSKDLKDYLFEYQDVVVDDRDGSVFFVGKAYENDMKKNKKDGESNYHYEIFKLNASETKLLTFKTLDHFVNSTYLLYDKNEFFCIGFYSEKNDYRYKGTFKLQIDPNTMEIKTQNYFPFSEQFLTDKYGKVKDKELKNISYRSVILGDDGDIIINGEEYYIEMVYVPNANGTGGHWRITYHYDDIISAKIKSDNTLAWARNINKDQVGNLNYNPHSYFSTYVNGKNYFFVNLSDNIKKLSKDRIEFVGAAAKKSNLYVIVIDENGDFDYKKLMDNDELEVVYSVIDGVNVGDGWDKIVFLGRKVNKKQLMKIEIK